MDWLLVRRRHRIQLRRALRGLERRNERPSFVKDGLLTLWYAERMAVNSPCRLDLRIEGRSATLFRLLLAVKRQKRSKLTMDALARAIVAAYLHTHMIDIMNDVTEEIQRAADEAYTRPRKLFPRLSSSHSRRPSTGPAAVPRVSDAGIASISCGGRSPPSFAEAVRDKAAE